jgi:hypothetical protein
MTAPEPKSIQLLNAYIDFYKPKTPQELVSVYGKLAGALSAFVPNDKMDFLIELTKNVSKSKD